MVAGATQTVSIQLKNTGDLAWETASNYKIGSQNPLSNTYWGSSRVELPQTVSPGQTVTITFQIKAPLTAGTYNFQWRMVQDGVMWFGPYTPNVAIKVVSGSIGATPNPCNIAAGTSSCSTTVNWSSSSSTSEVWVSGLDGSNPQLFARAQNGPQSASWIGSYGHRFTLKSDGLAMASVDVRGNLPPNISWSAVPFDGSIFVAPASITLGVYASDPDGNVQRVEFWIDSTRQTVTSAPYQIVWSNIAAGSHTLQAVAYDNLGHSSWSSASNITVRSTAILGNIDGLSSDGTVTGWACSSYLAQSIPVHVYLGGPAGSGTFFGSYMADQSSEPAVASACGVGGGSYRFRIALSQAQRIQYSGKAIYIHGISPVGGDNLLIANSGAFTVTAPSPVETVSASVDYDELGRAIALRDSAGRIKLSYEYDANGNVTKVTDALNHATTMTYDALDRVNTSTDAAGQVTAYQHDAAGRVVKVTDPRGNATSYTYDGLGQLWQQASPDTGVTVFAYDAQGLLLSMTRANGVQTTYGYDALYRPTTVSAGGQTRLAAYDACTNGVGRLCSVSDSTGSTSYSYTPEGEVAGRGFSIQGTTYALGYSYDNVGRLAAVAYPDGNRATYSYANGRVAGVAMTVGGTTSSVASAVAYRPDGAMASWTSSNGLTNTLGYDGDGRLASISVPGVQNLALAYDDADRITRITNGIDGALTQSFGYDALSRLTSVASMAGNASYQYDATGNRVGQTVGGVSTPSVIDPASNRLLAFGATSYGYDANGNMTTVAGAQRYHYDAFNRMDSAAGASYYVNPEGQRLRKSGSGGTSYFAPDQSNAMLSEYSGSWIDYVWLNGRLVGRVAGGQFYAVHSDQVGRPEAVTDASKGVVWRAQNFAFTQNVTTAGIVFNLGFPGQYYDEETATWNNGFRDYKSELGRYVESDPIGLAGGINTYAYVSGNPLNRIDPLGLETTVIINNNNMFVGTHAGLYIGRGALDGQSTGGPEIYDPSGSYLNNTRGEGGVFYDQDASLGDYLAYQMTDGSNVQIYTFNTTASEEEAIAKKAESLGDPRGLNCASSVSRALNGIGPFKNLGTFKTPTGLGAALRTLSRGY